MKSNISSTKNNDNIIISVNNLHKSFNGTKVLENISFTLKKGEILGVIGPSGSGKTTLLRCIDLLENFEKGEVIYNKTWKVSFDNEGYININDVKENNILIPEKEIIKIRQDIGFVFQHFNLWEEKTVLKKLNNWPNYSTKKIKKKKPYLKL